MHGLVAAVDDAPTLERAFEIVGQFGDLDGTLPAAESATLAMELLLERALGTGLDAAALDSPAYGAWRAAREKAASW